MTFSQVEHTADIALKIEAKNEKELFCEAARGLFWLLAEGRAKPEKSWKLKVKAHDLESLLIGWLNELLYLFEVKNIALSEVEILEINDKAIKASIKGEEYTEEKFTQKHQIKAATYHNINIKRNGKFEAIIIFDV